MAVIAAPRPTRAPRAPDRTPVRVALLIGLALIAVAVAVTLAGAPSEVTASNGIALERSLGQTTGASVCQPGETLPRGTSAIRISVEAAVGPRVAVQASSGGRLLTSGAQGSGWSGATVTVPVEPLGYTASKVTLCFAIGHTGVHVALLGAQTSPASAARAVGGRALPGRVRTEYLRAGGASWASLAESVARRMGLGRAVSGTWISVAVLLAMLVLVLVVARLALGELPGNARPALGELPPDGRPRRERTPTEAGRRVVRSLRRVPRAAWVCALVACVNAVCWSVITPAFQVPDEPNHFSYTELLAEGPQLPRRNVGETSPALQVALEDLRYYVVRFAPQNRALASTAQQRKLERDLTAPLSLQGEGGAGAASDEPPLYYALETIPYSLASGGSVLERLELMRLLSALMAAGSALFAYLFLREALPGSRWSWTVGGLAVALSPLLGFMSGGVNPDAMLCTVCTALYYLLARAFRRGLTPRLAIAIALVTVVGFATKLNFVGFAPGAIVGLIWLGVRAGRRRARGTAGAGRAHAGAGRTHTGAGRAGAYGAYAIAPVLALSPVLLYGVVNLLSNRAGLGQASRTLNGAGGSVGDALSYVWQFYLPRLPGMTSYFPGIQTTRQFWFDGLVGLYGWADTPFPGWVYHVALIPAGLIVALALAALVRARGSLRRRALETSVYALTAIGMMALVGTQSYVSNVVDKFEPFAEPRYALPVLALWGLLVTVGVRGLGRRWGPPVGALLIAVFLAHDVFSQLQVIARYYG